MKIDELLAERSTIHSLIKEQLFKIVNWQRLGNTSNENCKKGESIPEFLPDFTEMLARARMGFAIHNLYRDWRNLVFCDEKVFYSNTNSLRIVYRTGGERYNPKYVIGDESSGRVSIAYWGRMTASAVGDLIGITEKLTGANYRIL